MIRWWSKLFSKKIPHLPTPADTTSAYFEAQKHDFLSMASHELRTPLTSIKGSLSLLNATLSEGTNEQALRLVRIAELETDRMIRLTNDLLDLAKLEAHAFSTKPNWCSFNRLVDESTEAMHGLQATTGIEVRTEKIEDDIEVFVDHDSFKQVMANLLSNAIKYSPLHGIVFVHFDLTDPKQLVVKVSDQGWGIAPDEQKIIFEKFKQSSNSNHVQVKGTGLGLAIVKALIELHAGHVGVESEMGHGSTFYFTLPQWRIANSQGSQDSGQAA